MEEESEKIIFLPAQNYASVIYPEGRSRASSVAAELMLENQELSYGPPADFKKGVYGKVIAHYASPTKAGRPLLAVLTYPFSDKEEVEAETCLVLVEDDQIEAVEPTEAVTKILKKTKTPKVVAPPPPPRIKTQKEILDEVLDSIFPDNYSWAGTQLILRFPEVIIANGSENHTIRDLLVRLDFNTAYDHLTGVPRGARLTISEEEAVSGYRHSHLGGYTVGEWGTFCLGYTSLAQLVMDMMEQKITEDKFIVLLHWLGEYVKWESLAGGPHYRISDMRALVRERNGSRAPSVNLYDPRCIASSLIERSIRCIISSIDHTWIQPVINGDGSVRWILSPSRIAEVATLLCTRADAPTLRYDRVSKQFISSNRQTDPQERINNFERGSYTFKDKKIQCKVIRRTEEQTLSDIITVVAPLHLLTVIRGINAILNTGKLT